MKKNKSSVVTKVIIVAGIIVLLVFVGLLLLYNSNIVMQDLDKKFYKIGDVAKILELPESTLRYWESQFTIIKPRRNAKNIRFYTPNDIETIRKIYYLVKEKGFKLDAAQAQIRANRDGVDKRFEVVTRLKQVKDQLKQLQQALDAVNK